MAGGGTANKISTGAATFDPTDVFTALNAAYVKYLMKRKAGRHQDLQDVQDLRLLGKVP